MSDTDDEVGPTPPPWRAISGGVVCDAQHTPNHHMDPGDLKHYGGYLLAESIIRPADAHLMAAAPELEAVARAVLVFHLGGPWTDWQMAEWKGLLEPVLGAPVEEVTTKVLCDAARAALAKAEGKK